MIYTIKIVNPKNESILLDLYNPWETGLAIQSIDGLGPTQAEIRSTEVATIDGGIFNSARQNQRNIVFNFLLMGCPTIEAARLKVYKYFPIKKKVRMTFKTEFRNVETDGYVETVSPDIFSRQETVQVSLVCPDPNFYELAESYTVFSGVQPMFEFPFENNSLTENLLEMGEIMLDTRTTFNYIGDSDTGMTITIHAYGHAENITIWNNLTNEKMSIDTNKIYKQTGVRLDRGDDILISTVQGNKYIRLLHNGKLYNIISCINRGADWFQLTNGDNMYTFTAESGEEQLIVTFSYRNAYGGI